MKSSIKVRNTGNVPAYIRVFALVYWQDSKGNVNKKYTDLPALEVSSDWIAYGDNIYYYVSPVEPDELTEEFLDLASLGGGIALAKKVDTIEGVEYEYNQVIQIVAEAIQAEPETAVTESWSVTVDANGNIINGN